MIFNATSGPNGIVAGISTVPAVSDRHAGREWSSHHGASLVERDDQQQSADRADELDAGEHATPKNVYLVAQATFGGGV